MEAFKIGLMIWGCCGLIAYGMFPDENQAWWRRHVNAILLLAFGPFALGVVLRMTIEGR